MFKILILQKKTGRRYVKVNLTGNFKSGLLSHDFRYSFLDKDKNIRVTGDNLVQSHFICGEN